MSCTAPMILSNSLKGLAEYLELKSSLSFDAMLERAGIDVRPPWDDEKRIPLDKYASLLEMVAVEADEPCLGLEFARGFPDRVGGVLGFLIASAADLRSFMHCLHRYARLQIEALSLTYSEANGLLHIVWEYDASFIGPRKQLTEFLMALFVFRANKVFGGHISPLAAEFEYRDTGCTDRYRSVFGTHLRFGSTQNSLTTRADILSRRNISANPDTADLFKLMRRLAEEELQKSTVEHDIVAQLRQQIGRHLAHEVLQLDTVASRLEMTGRQLQAQLKRRETTFEIEFGRVREQLAARYLRDTDMTMTDIALMLGFSELSSFTRAARAWFQMPPSVYRAQTRAAKSD